MILLVKSLEVLLHLSALLLIKVDQESSTVLGQPPSFSNLHKIILAVFCVPFFVVFLEFLGQMRLTICLTAGSLMPDLSIMSLMQSLLMSSSSSYWTFMPLIIIIICQYSSSEDSLHVDLHFGPRSFQHFLSGIRGNRCQVGSMQSHNL